MKSCLVDGLDAARTAPRGSASGGFVRCSSDVVRSRSARSAGACEVGVLAEPTDDGRVGRGDQVDVAGLERLRAGPASRRSRGTRSRRGTAAGCRPRPSASSRGSWSRSAVAGQVLLDDERTGADRPGRRLGSASTAASHVGEAMKPGLTGEEVGNAATRPGSLRSPFKPVKIVNVKSSSFSVDQRAVGVLGDVLESAPDTRQAAEPAVEVVDHGVGVERRAVVERDALADLDREHGRSPRWPRCSRRGTAAISRFSSVTSSGS